MFEVKCRFNRNPGHWDEKEGAMFTQTDHLLNYCFYEEKLMDRETYQEIKSKILRHKYWHESCFESAFLKLMYMICEKKEYFPQTLPNEWYQQYIKDNKQRLIDDGFKDLLDFYKVYRKRMYEYNKPENVAKRELEQKQKDEENEKRNEERRKQEQIKNQKLYPRIMRDMMRYSEGGIIFPDKDSVSAMEIDLDTSREKKRKMNFIS